MDVYLFQADLHCKDCGKAICERLTAEGIAPADPSDECSFDSDDFPKGPYPDGGGEADYAAHCGSCGLFLDNHLTEDGSTHVKAAWRDHVLHGDGSLPVLIEWRDGYPCEWTEFCEEMEFDGTDALDSFKRLAGE